MRDTTLRLTSILLAAARRRPSAATAAAPPGQSTVIVTLKDRADLSALRGLPRNERRRAIVEALQRRALLGQVGLRAFLAVRRLQGAGLAGHAALGGQRARGDRHAGGHRRSWPPAREVLSVTPDEVAGGAPRRPGRPAALERHGAVGAPELWALGYTGPGRGGGQPRHRRGRSATRTSPGAGAAGGGRLVRSLRPARRARTTSPATAPGPLGVLLGGDASGVDHRRGARRPLDRRAGLRRRGAGHRLRHPPRLPVGPRPRRRPGHRRRPRPGQRLLGLRLARLQPRVPARPAGAGGGRHRAGLRRGQLRPLRATAR